MDIGINPVKYDVFQEFFNDPNVRFPNMPKLISNISIYEAPYGLGLQFRGGPKKLIIKGKNTPLIWKELHGKLDGKHQLKRLIEIGVNRGIDVIDICNFFKILHSYHLFERIEGIKNNLEYFDINQLNFYNRLVGVSGYNDTGIDIYDRIKQTKILLICSSEFINNLTIDLKLSGFNDFGILFINNKKGKINNTFLNDDELMIFEDISSMDNEEFNNLLFKKVNDYNFIISVLNNPSEEYLKNLTIFCSNNDKCLLPINLRINNYEVGPFFTPKVSACPHLLHSKKSESRSKLSIRFCLSKSFKRKRGKIRRKYNRV